MLSLAMHNLALAYKTKRDYVRAQYWLREALDIARSTIRNS